MQKIDGQLRLSASDLMRFKSCAHATTMDLRFVELGDVRPAADSDEAALLQSQGDAHERAFLQKLRDQGHDVAEINKDRLTFESAVEATGAALRSGAAIVFQGALLGDEWGGFSDFLERVDRPSKLGNFSYEVVDTKLKRSPDPKHILQLVLYSDLLAGVQGAAPEFAHLELGDGNRFSVRLSDVSAYSRRARLTFMEFLAERPETRPQPVSSCGICRWREHCQAEWERNDALALVAGMTRDQRRKIEAAGIMTMTALASLKGRIPKLAPETQQRLQSQARLQAARRAGGPPSFELRAFEPGRGLGLLPEPADGDLFYDIEGDPYYPDKLEYLHGVWFKHGGAWIFKELWAHDRQREGQVVGELLAFFVERLQRYPRAHIYHYGNYEVSALRRLTAHHRVGEAAMDQLQRERRFVDLHKVISGSLIASEAGYSIKDLEAFYMPKREGDVATAGASVVYYERWRETGDATLLEKIRAYNETDCISTQKLRDWLVSSVRPAGMPWPILSPMGPDAQLTSIAMEDAEAAALRLRLAPLRARLGDEVADLLFDLNFFHKRDDKPTWWGIFDRLAGEAEALFDDLECIAGLEAVSPPVAVTRQSIERTYRFPAQETKLRAGKKPCVKPAERPEDVDLRSIDHDTFTLVLRRSRQKGLPDGLCLIPPQPIRKKVLQDALGAVTDELIRNTGRFRAIEHLLLRAPPAFVDGTRPQGIIQADVDLPAAVSRAIADMDYTVLAVQGPPGTGKTYVSAVAIVDLVRAGNRVAVSSNSHKAIENLLLAIVERAGSQQVPCRVVQKVNDDEEESPHARITLVADNDAPQIASAHVVGATAWHFARYDAPAYDYLFVDEAGQVSLANIVAMGRCARNIVLVGDPMQLAQPSQGVHPGRSGESSLEYLIDGHRVVPSDRGIFLPVSRRMHPRVCEFISTAVYEGRLDSDDGAKSQSLTDAEGKSHAGATMIRVGHSGRSQTCPEELEAIQAKIAAVHGMIYRDRDGVERRIGDGDILVVAPYNAQVNLLRAALPADVQVGTVDRFQGQEAPICLVSMTTSSGDELPRDIEFLFSLNRINVAVSRAQAMAAVFASPALLDVPCTTIREMALVNTLCLLEEYGIRQPGQS